jgi:exodeoxyribonuclease X
MMRFRVIDIETTGMAPPAEIIEFGRVDVTYDGATYRVEDPVSILFRPVGEIPPETMAVHHLTMADFTDDTPVCTPDNLAKALWGGETPDVLVAHNAAFERLFITEAVTSPLEWICTYKAAMRVWPEAPKHSNQVLRYWRCLELDPVLAMPPHRAAPDAYVTAHLLVDLLSEASVKDLLDWTEQPAFMPVVPFGRYKGALWSEVPGDYLQWVAGAEEMDPDRIWHARQELGRRSG